MSLGSALAGLAALAGGGKKKALSKDAIKVVDAFINGVPRDGGCRVPKKGERRDPSSCRFTTDGRHLIVNGETLASKASPIASSMELCFTGTRSDPALRQMAAALSHRLGTGIGVADLGSRSPKKGSFGPPTAPDWRFSAGRKGHAMRVPKGCVEVVISDAMQKRAEGAIENWGKGEKLRAAKRLKERAAEIGLQLPKSLEAVMATRNPYSDFPEGYNPEESPKNFPTTSSAVAAVRETEMFPDG